VASRFREEHLRHYLVVDAGGRRYGVISQTDVVVNQGIEHYLRLRKVRSIIATAPPLVHSTQEVHAAIRQMREARADAMAVEFPGGELGIVTERDVVRCIAERLGGCSIDQVASRPLLTVAADSSLFHARNLLVDSGVRHVGVTDSDGGLISLISFSDILSDMEFVYIHELRSALQARDNALSLSRRSLHLAEKIIDSSPQGIMITDLAGRIVSVNPAFSRLTGYRAEEAVGNTPSMLASGRHDDTFYQHMWGRITADGYWQGEIWNRRKNGETYPELLTITAIHNEQGQLTNFAALFSDITELKENEQRVTNLAYYDPLTGLPNRRLFSDRLAMALAHAHRYHTRMAVLFLDLDRFKRINDSLGHEVGDRLLQQVASRLRGCVREDDTVARQGGDEFVTLLAEIDELADATQIARRMIESLRAPIEIGGNELFVSSSIGIAVYPDDGTSEELLLRNADAAMYEAKESGRNGFRLYSPTMNASSLQHLALESSLRKALSRNEFLLHYQPLVDARDGSLVGGEALLRWHSPDLGLVMPDGFIPLAEESGLIVPIGEWVLEQACAQIAAWQAQGLEPPEIAINISARQFRHSHFLNSIRETLERHGIEPRRLVLELTESMLMEDAVETIRVLHELRAIGVSIAVDDFGTGYSSLNYLKRFPIRRLKIDRSFVRDLVSDAEDAAIVSAVISLAHNLGLGVVAEGVENVEQLAALAERGCDIIQGFLFHRPLPANEFGACIGAGRLEPQR